ncbi:MAG: DUF1109 family protein [Bdellovibrionales bacterium]|nr:DUF1109 family protein [Bdellovibrionales bacterium]
MDHNQNLDLLIQELQKKLPTKTLPGAAHRFFRWILVSILYNLIGISFLGMARSPLTLSHVSMEWMEIALLIAILVTASLTALMISVPGQEQKHKKKWITGMLLLWPLLLVALYIAVSDKIDASQAWYGGCTKHLLLFFIPPFVLLLWMLKKAAPTTPLWTSICGTLGPLALAALSVKWTCPSDNGLHMLISHSLPLLLIAGVLLWPIKKSLRW